MKAINEMTQAELGAYVQTHLRKLGIDVVLSGGAAVAIYSEGKYVSKDLDFVNRFFTNRSSIKQAMEDLGFTEFARYFTHPDTQFFVEFPPGPLSFGEEPVSRTNEITFDTGILKLITAADCVKDRLAWYYHFGDKQCLEQAILVCKAHSIDLDEIRRWSQVEGKLNDFKQIKKKLGG
jgi:hypothetical protein